MTSEFAEAIKQIQHDRGIPEELVLKTVKEFLLAAYKKKFGTDENAIVKFNEDNTDVALYALRQIVEDVYDPVAEIELEDALEYSDECELGDELLIEIKPSEFDRLAVQSAKQKAKQNLRDIQKDTLYSEFEDKEGELIIGYFQRERNGNIFIDLGKTEGILPRKYQSPRESYRPGDRIKTIINEVRKTASGLQIVLSRTHSEFVKKIFELEVPEIYDNTVEITNIVRQAGYRTKIAVSSYRDDVDPVGACVGLKGVRIQAIVRELEGEKIDILKYDPDPVTYIKNALSPAQVNQVYMLDNDRKSALAVVDDQQLSLAIGKQGLNVRLANRLVDWNIDVKTVEQFEEMDVSSDLRKDALALFDEDYIPNEKEEIVRISELPNISERLVSLLRENGIELIETLVSMNREALESLEGFSEDDITEIAEIINDNVEIIEEELDEEEAEEYDEYEEESYLCPECDSPITIDMTNCPNCGVGLSFEIEEDDEDILE